MSQPQINKFLTAVSDKLKSEQKRLDIRASGKSAKSLRIESDDTGGALYGEEYFLEQEEGSGPQRGKIRYAVLLTKIRDWLDTKAFARSFSTRKKDALQYPITKNLLFIGSKRGNDPRFPGLPVTKIINQEKSVFLEKLEAAKVAQFSSQIFKGIK